MHLVSLIFLSIAANLDNLSIGMAYGIRKVRIPLISNFAISVISGLFTLFTCILGSYFSDIISCHLSNILGGCIIFIMGIWVIIGYFTDKKKNNIKNHTKPKQSSNANVEEFIDIMQHPDKADVDYSGDISIKESVLLGIALALNCLATGFGAGMTGLNAIEITVATILFSFLSIFFGLIIGKKCSSSFLGNKATIFTGSLLIIIGLYEVFI